MRTRPDGPARRSPSRTRATSLSRRLRPRSRCGRSSSRSLCVRAQQREPFPLADPSPALSDDSTGEAIYRARVCDLPWPRRQGIAAIRRRLRHAAAEFHRLRLRDGRSRGGLARRGARGRPHPRPRSPHAGLRRRADRRANRRGGRLRPPLLRGAPPGRTATSISRARIFTEKAFPENEVVYTNTHHARRRCRGRQRGRVRAALRRAEPDRGRRARSTPSGKTDGWTGGLGDVALAFRRTLRRESAHGHDRRGRRRSRVSDRRCGSRPRQRLSRVRAVRDVRTGAAAQRVPPGARRNRDPVGSRSQAPKEAYLRTAMGFTHMADRGFGRSWSPQLEVLLARPFGGDAEWDVVPQLQVSLSKIQHVMRGRRRARCRSTQRDERGTADRDLSAVGLVRRSASRASGSRRCVAHQRAHASSSAVGAAGVRCSSAVTLRHRRPPPAAAARLRRAHAAAGLFAHSENCVACHNNLSTPAGEDVSIGAAWRSTMMANSARDPYFHASVRRETIDHPAHVARDPGRVRGLPHADGARKRARRRPAARCFARSASGAGPMRTTGWRATACRARSAIRSRRDGSGTRDSFNGNFRLRPARADGVRDIFGPFAVDAGRHTIMRSVTGFEQVEAPHIRQSELCATCHTLITEALGPRRRGDRLAARADELPGMAAQRVLRRGAELPVLPHAARRRPAPGLVGARRGARRPVPPRVRRRQRVHAPDAEPLPGRARRRGAAGRSSRRPRARPSSSCGRTRPRVAISSRRRSATARWSSTSASAT